MVRWPGDDPEELVSQRKGVQSVVTKECPRTGKQIADWDFKEHVGRFSTKVSENIYLGNNDNATDWEQLTHSKDTITNILVVMRGGKEIFVEEGIKYRVLEIDDLPAERLIDLLGEACEYIKSVVDAKGKVLVHCDTGRSRAAAVVLAYLINKGASYKKALAKLNKARKKMFQSEVAPNHGFVRQLRKFEKSKKKKR